MAAHRLDLTGRRFGRLLAQHPEGTSAYSIVLWRCQCDCGQSRLVPANMLKAGKVLHCGCQTSANRSARNTKAAIAKRARKTAWQRQKRAADNAARQSAPIKRPSNGPLDVFLYGHPAPNSYAQKSARSLLMEEQRFQDLL